MTARVMLKIPALTQNGRVFKLGGLGMPRLGKEGKGDLYARVRVRLPEQLDDEQTDAVRGAARGGRVVRCEKRRGKLDASRSARERSRQRRNMRLTRTSRTTLTTSRAT